MFILDVLVVLVPERLDLVIAITEGHSITDEDEMLEEFRRN